MPVLDIDDTEAPHCNPDVSLKKKSIIVRTSMNNRTVHVRKNFGVGFSIAIVIENAADSAHD